MKKYFFLLIVPLLLAFTVPAQRAYTVATLAVDTLTDAETAYAYVYKTGTTKENFNSRWYFTAQAHVDHLSGSTDSTQVSWEGSMDGSLWVPLGYAATGTAVANANVGTAFSTITWLTTDDTYIWGVTTPIQVSYIRAKIQHYATGTITYSISAKIYQ